MVGGLWTCGTRRGGRQDLAREERQEREMLPRELGGYLAGEEGRE